MWANFHTPRAATSRIIGLYCLPSMHEPQFPGEARHLEICCLGLSTLWPAAIVTEKPLPDGRPPCSDISRFPSITHRWKIMWREFPILNNMWFYHCGSCTNDKWIILQSFPNSPGRKQAAGPCVWLKRGMVTAKAFPMMFTFNFLVSFFLIVYSSIAQAA